MKRQILTLLTAIVAIGVQAQVLQMNLNMKDGRTISMPMETVADISFSKVGMQTADENYTQLSGQWLLVAMPYGSTGTGGIGSSQADTIRFTATLPAEDSIDYGRTLSCHTDRLYWRSGQDYPADWRMAYESDGTKFRIGWVLDGNQPASAKQFLEPQEKFLEDGFFYWAKKGEDDRFIYLLSENIETQRLEGMTLWSDWTAPGSDTFLFPQTHEVYGVVATQKPYQPSASAGYFEIWASPRFVRPKE